jgi:hypothetical protein
VTALPSGSDHDGRDTSFEFPRPAAPSDNAMRRALEEALESAGEPDRLLAARALIDMAESLRDALPNDAGLITLLSRAFLDALLLLGDDQAEVFPDGHAFRREVARAMDGLAACAESMGWLADEIRIRTARLSVESADAWATFDGTFSNATSLVGLAEHIRSGRRKAYYVGISTHVQMGTLDAPASVADSIGTKAFGAAAFEMLVTLAEQANADAAASAAKLGTARQRDHATARCLVQAGRVHEVRGQAHESLRERVRALESVEGCSMNCGVRASVWISVGSALRVLDERHDDAERALREGLRGGVALERPDVAAPALLDLSYVLYRKSDSAGAAEMLAHAIRCARRLTDDAMERALWADLFPTVSTTRGERIALECLAMALADQPRASASYRFDEFVDAAGAMGIGHDDLLKTARDRWSDDRGEALLTEAVGASESETERFLGVRQAPGFETPGSGRDLSASTAHREVARRKRRKWRSRS